MAHSGSIGAQNFVVFFVNCGRRYCKTLENTSLQTLNMAFYDGDEENTLLRANLKSHSLSLLLKLHFRFLGPARSLPDDASRTNASSIIWTMPSLSSRTARMAETIMTFFAQRIRNKRTVFCVKERELWRNAVLSCKVPEQTQSVGARGALKLCVYSDTFLGGKDFSSPTRAAVVFTRQQHD